MELFVVSPGLELLTWPSVASVFFRCAETLTPSSLRQPAGPRVTGVFQLANSSFFKLPFSVCFKIFLYLHLLHSMIAFCLSMNSV